MTGNGRKLTTLQPSGPMPARIAPHPDDSRELDVLDGARTKDSRLVPQGHALDRLQDNGVSTTRVGALAAKEPSPLLEQQGPTSPVAESPVAESPESPIAKRGNRYDADLDEETDLHQMQRARASEAASKQKEQTWYEWLLQPRPPPPLPWDRSREDAIKKWIADKRKYNIVRGLFSEAALYKMKASTRLTYHGERDDDKRKDGRGAAKWPDPPFGGGEEYLGLWRKDQPHTSGVFCWFNGDVYFGEFAEGGVFQGLGVYDYGAAKEHRGDSYWGSYNKGVRTGLGVYTFSNNGARKVSGTYAGEWLKGAFHGLGSLTYSDGEMYIGHWEQDKKHGLGKYSWGRDSEHAGDYYQGQMENNQIAGWGASKMADGGYHKGEYARGRRNGWGVQRDYDGTQYMGQWVDDELDGFVVVFNAYQQLRHNSKVTQQYQGGDLISSRAYQESDYTAIELTALEAEMQAEEAQQRAARVVHDVKSKAGRIRDTVSRATAARETAIYWANVALQLRKHMTAWFGLKGLIFPSDLQD